MKRFLALIWGLLFICILAGCVSEPNTPDVTDPGTDSTTESDRGDVTEELTTDADFTSQEPPSIGCELPMEIAQITDTTKEMDVDLPDAEEPFYEDRQYVYIFENPISEYVIVEYSDGTEENVKAALNSGHIALYDLDRFGIQYFAEPKLIADIIDHAESGEYCTDDALEPFYFDETYAYIFPSIRSHYVIVYFKDGTEQPIREALAAGTVKIRDLDWFGISYWKEERK